MITRVCMIRHGETDWNVVKRIQGQIDIPLNANGRTQAMAMAFNAAHRVFHAVYSSDLLRAYDTAGVLVGRVGGEVHKHKGLRERHYGVLQGNTAPEVLEAYPELHRLYKARDLACNFETGESLVEFAGRVRAVLTDLVRHHEGRTIAVVAHAGVLDIVYRDATHRPLHTERDFIIPNCSLNWFHVDAHGWHLDAWDDHHHLSKVQLESVE